MKEHPNFYENLKEAQDRLNRTVVLYDNLPYFVHAITDHKKDGIFRMYLDPVGRNLNEAFTVLKPFLNICSGYAPDYPLLGQELDKWLDATPDCGVLRKQMNSPFFNRFRPFPLGMCNIGTQVYYVERQPIRPAMQQGLTKSACFETLITAGSRQDSPTRIAEKLDIQSPAFKDCILGDHYSPYEVLKYLLDPTVAHDALAFHREFALVHGPIDLLFLAYRSDIIGILPKNNFEFVRLGQEFSYCKEVVEELNLFNRVI
jgi:hypothetical protein